MSRSVKEVLSHGADFVAKLDAAADGIGEAAFYADGRMDGVLVLPDEIVHRYYEATYLWNTHFSPNRLPGVGMGTGDFVTHEGKTYLVINFDIYNGNMAALHLFREHEPWIREWKEKKDAYVAQVAELIAAVAAVDADFFGLAPLQSADQWAETAVGWDYSDTPSPEFLDALLAAAPMLTEKGASALAETAVTLESELRGFSRGAAVMLDIRQKVHHKGIPYVGDGIIGLTSPMASGEASIHNKNASDDLMSAVPNRSDIFMVAGQTPFARIPHIGGGQNQGENFVMLLPRTPFFDLAQGRLNGNESLAAAWDQLSADERGFAEWHPLTEPLKREVLREILPTLLDDQVLGFSMNMKDVPGIALLRPIIAESTLRANEEVIASADLKVVWKNVAGFLLRQADNYYAVRGSLLDEQAA